MPRRSSKETEKLDRLATAIGHICMAWGRLEQQLNEFIEVLAPLETGDVSNAVTAGMDIRTKIQTVKALAFTRKPSERWFRDLALVLDYIDNDLRVRRNRVIHDGWYIPKGSLIREARQVKFLRPQAFKLTLTTETKTRVRLPAVEKLRRELDDLPVPLFLLWMEGAGYERMSLPDTDARRFRRRLKPSSRQKNVRSAH